MAQEIQINDSINKLHTQKSVAGWTEEFNYGQRAYPITDATKTFLTVDAITEYSGSTVISKENNIEEELLIAS